MEIKYLKLIRCMSLFIEDVYICEYVPGKAQYSRNIYALDLDKMDQSTVF